MGLLSPWFLAGILAAGLPLWLHLLRQFQRTPRPFSSLMFFERRVQSSTRHRRLRYLALLAMRLLLLALLSLAFSNPFVNENANTARRRALTVIALDRSFSMRTGDRMNEAKAQAQRILNGMGGSSLVQVVAFDSHLEALSQPQPGGSGLHGVIDGIQAGDDISSYGELSRGLRVMEQTSGLQINAHVITDVQQTSMPATFSDLDVGPHLGLTIHPIGSETPNWAVENVDVPAHVYDANNVRVSAVVAGWNTKPVTRVVKLELDGRTMASKTTNIAANGRCELVFDDINVSHGMHRGHVLIEPHDALPQDDVFAFSIERSDPKSVLFLHAAGRRNEAFYYKSALEASSFAGLTVQPVAIEDLSGQDLSRFAFIVLNNPGALDDAATRTIADYITKGGAALIAIGPNTTREHVVPIGGESLNAYEERQGAETTSTGSSVLVSPGQFANVEFLQSPRLLVKPREAVLARFADGSPLLVEKNMGEGRLLLFAATLDNSTSDFPLHTSFLPFVAQTGAYLARTQGDPSSTVVGTLVPLRQSNTESTAADVIGPDGKHLLALAEATRAMSYNVSREGFYEVQRAGRQRAVVAVHADRRESDLTHVPVDTLKIWRNTGDNSAEPLSGMTQQIVQRRLWRYVLTLALLAAFVESMFGMRYLTRERQTG